MQALTNSAFLQALGYAIANSLWQVALLWMIFVALTTFIKMGSASKYRLAVAAQLLGFAWFIVTLEFFYAQCSEALRQSTQFVSRQHFNLIVPEAGKSFQSQLVSFLLKGEQFLPYLSAAYLLLLVFLVVKWARSYNHAQNIRHNGLHKIDVDWKLFIKDISGQLGIKQDVKIYLSELVKTPMTIGFFKPIILVPLASINNLSTEQMEAVLLHELAHIKRFDYLLNLVLSIVETTLFFNPFTQLISRSIKKERENSCDDWVLQFKYNPSMYAEALLRIAYLQASPAFAMTFANGNKNDLLFRVKRMIETKESKFNYRHQLLALLLMTGVFSSVAWLQPMNKKQDVQVRTEDLLRNKKTLVKVPTLANVGNPLFNPVWFLEKPMQKEIEKVVEKASKEMVLGKIETEAAEAASLNELATVMPVAAKNLEEINWEEVDKNVQENMKTVFPREMARTAQVMGITYDSSIYKNAFNYSYSFNNDEFKKSWQQIADEMKKVGIQLEKAFKTKGKVKIQELQRQQEELNKAMAQLNKEGTWQLFNQQKRYKMAQPLEALVVAGHQQTENARLHSLRAMQVSQRERVKSDSLRAVTITATGKRTPVMLRGKMFSTNATGTGTVKDMPICLVSNIIPEVVPITTSSSNEDEGYSFSYNTKKTVSAPATAPKSTASKVNICTSVDSKATANGSQQKTKRYEIVVTDKNGQEKKLTVVVEE